MSVTAMRISALVLFTAATAVHGQTGTLNVVHGIPGATVDVCVSGDITGNEFARVIEEFDFTETRTRELPEGFYDANVVLAGDDCADALPGLSATDLFLPAGANVSVVANLDNPGGAFELNVFVNDLSGLRPGQADVAVQHTADAPAVDVWIGRNNNKLVRTFAMFTNGDQETGSVKPGRLAVALSLPGQDDVLLDPANLRLRPDTYYAIYAVGTFPDTFTYVVLPIPASR